MNGVIKVIRRAKQGEAPAKGCGSGYGFIIDENGEDRFFSHNNVLGDVKFDTLTEGSKVEFEPVFIVGKGLRAEKVKVLA